MEATANINAVSTSNSTTTTVGKWWPLSERATWWLVGGSIALGGLLLLLRRGSRGKERRGRAWQGAEQPPAGEYDDILANLRSDDPACQTAAVRQLYEYSRYPKKHEGIRQTGVLENLLQILATHPEDEELLLNLTRVVANLATGQENRLVLGQTSTVFDLFFLLEHTTNRSGIKEHILRCLLNLSLEDSIEDVIRETGGLRQLTEMFSAETTSPVVRFQTTRVLINLVHNANNREVLTKEGLVEKAVHWLKSDDATEELRLRLVNLLGLFAVDCAPEVLAQIATKETAEAFNKLLTFSQGVDPVSTVLQAILKILARKQAHRAEVQPFLDTFVSPTITDEATGTVQQVHPTGLENVVHVLKTAEGPVVDQARQVMVDLVEDDESATQALTMIDAALLPQPSSSTPTSSE